MRLQMISGHKGTKAGHRDTVCVDTTKPDMRTVEPGAKSLRSADPRKGVCRSEKRARQFLFATVYQNWIYPSRYVKLLSGGAKRGCTVALKVKRSMGRGRRTAVCSRLHFEGYGRDSETTSDPERHGRPGPLVSNGAVLSRKYRPGSSRQANGCSGPGSNQESSPESHCEWGHGRDHDSGRLQAPIHLHRQELQPTDQTSQRARGRRRSPWRVCWRPHRWLQSNQDVGYGGHAESGEALQWLRTRTHLVGDPTSLVVAPH